MTFHVFVFPLGFRIFESGSNFSYVFSLGLELELLEQGLLEPRRVARVQADLDAGRPQVREEVGQIRADERHGRVGCEVALLELDEEERVDVRGHREALRLVGDVQGDAQRHQVERVRYPPVLLSHGQPRLQFGAQQRLLRRHQLPLRPLRQPRAPPARARRARVAPRA